MPSLQLHPLVGAFLGPRLLRVITVTLPLLLLAAIGIALYGARPTAAQAPPVDRTAVRTPSVASTPAPGLLVHVLGAVARPGVYRLRRGDRVDRAIAAAGGFLPSADPSRLPNLAGRLHDGEQVRVPFLRSGLTGRTAAVKLDINTASAMDMAAVPGFTADLADAVVARRESFGPFTSIRQLVTELGMPSADFALARASIAVR